MDWQNLAVKFYLSDPNVVPIKDYIPMFHHWIHDRLLDLVLIDVHDYSHVHHGPGIILVCHEANIGIDDQAGRRGVITRIKQPATGSSVDKLTALFKLATSVASLVEHSSKLANAPIIDAHRFTVTINNRLDGENNEANRTALAADLKVFLADLFPGAEVALTRTSEDSRARLALDVQISKPTTIAELQSQLG